MSFLLTPWHILLAVLCGLLNQRQQQIIEFQNAQIEALLKKLGRKRLLLDDDQRRLLAVKAHSIGRKALLELTTIFTPDTILRWYRELVAKKFDSSHKRKTGRRRAAESLRSGCVVPVEFESCPVRAPLAKRPVNLEGVVNQRVREFWSVWNGHRTEQWHFGTGARVWFRTRESSVGERKRRKS